MTKLKNMTLHQLLENGVTTVRLPKWNEFAFMKISGTPDNLLHPWGEMHDVGDFKQQVLIVGDTSNEWEQY